MCFGVSPKPLGLLQLFALNPTRVEPFEYLTFLGMGIPVCSRHRALLEVPGIEAGVRGVGCDLKACTESTSCPMSIFFMYPHLFIHVLALPSLNPCLCADHMPLCLCHGCDHVLPDLVSTQ